MSYRNNSCGCGKSSCTCNTLCGCKTALSTECIIYYGEPLDEIGVRNGDRGDLILEQIDRRFRYIKSLNLTGFVGANVGDGVQVYKGMNDKGVEEFRTLQDSDSVRVKACKETITFHVKEEFVKKVSASYENQIKELNTLVEGLKTTDAQFTQQLEEFKQQLIDLTSKLTSLQGEVNSLKSENTSVKHQIAELKNQVNPTIEKLDQLSNKFNEFLSKLERIGLSDVFTEEFLGLREIDLSREAVEIMSVSIDGLVLSNQFYTFSSPKKVRIRTTKLTSPLRDDSVIQITYKSKLNL